MRSRYWTIAEQSVLKAHYPVSGLSGCVALLPNRSRYSIYQHARDLGLKAPNQPAVRQHYPQSDLMDVQLRALHASPLSRGDVVAFAERIRRPVWWVSRRSRELGLITPRFKETRWAEAEVELLHATAHLSLARARDRFIKAGFNRSETSIQVKRKRLHARPQDNGYHNGNQIAELLGVDRKSVTRWISDGELSAKRRGDLWLISESALRSFIVRHPFQIQLRKIPAAHSAWFIDLIAGQSVSVGVAA